MNSKRFEDTFWKERLALTGVTDEDLKKRHGELERQLREAEIHVDAFFAAVEEKFGSEVAAALRAEYEVDSVAADEHLKSLRARARALAPEPDEKM